MEARVGPRAQELRDRARKVIPGGVSSNVRLAVADYFFSSGAGAWIWDVDGRDYVDYCLGQGPLLLGHANPAVDGAVAMACSNGMVYGAQHPLEVIAAEKTLEMLRWAGRVRFAMTGTEAVHAVIRLSRAATGKHRIVRFEGHYHGWADNIFIPLDGRAVPASRGQPSEMLQDLFVVPWNDAAEIETLLDEHGDEIACVIMEPVLLNRGAEEAIPGYLQTVRQKCTDHGVLLVFDEVITGFRLAPGGAVERYGVTPDIATYGKAIAGGWPVAAFAGRADVVDLLQEDVNHSGTFNGSVMAAAAVVATLSLLRDQPPYESIAVYGQRLMEGLRELARREGIPLEVTGLPTAFNLALLSGNGAKADDAASLVLHRALAQAGVWTTTRGLWFVSSVHGDRELEATLDRTAIAFQSLASHAKQELTV